MMKEIAFNFTLRFCWPYVGGNYVRKKILKMETLGEQK